MCLNSLGSFNNEASLIKLTKRWALAETSRAGRDFGSCASCSASFALFLCRVSTCAAISMRRLVRSAIMSSRAERLASRRFDSVISLPIAGVVAVELLQAP